MSGLNTLLSWIIMTILSFAVLCGIIYFTDGANDELKPVPQESELKLLQQEKYQVSVRCKNCGYGRSYDSNSFVWIPKGETIISSGVKCLKCDVPLSFGREK